MKKSVAVQSLENLRDYKSNAYLPSQRQETEEDTPLDSIIVFPQSHLNSEA